MSEIGSVWVGGWVGVCVYFVSSKTCDDICLDQWGCVCWAAPGRAPGLAGGLLSHHRHVWAFGPVDRAGTAGQQLFGAS